MRLPDVSRRQAPWEYTLLEKIIGEEIFAALNGELTDREALERCQTGIGRVMRSAGHY